MNGLKEALGHHIKTGSRKSVPGACVNNCSDSLQVQLKRFKLKNIYDETWRYVVVKTPLTPIFEIRNLDRNRVACGGGGTSEEALRRAKRKAKRRKTAVFQELNTRRERFGENFNLQRFMKNTGIDNSHSK